jgi:redox-sensitive bicupin YhaK (pirin superfamily)
MIKKIFTTKWKGEGVGATVRRAIGVNELPDLDPFLMLDFFKVKLPAGFPDHPHRGFETVTYMISGKILHEDFKGNAGEIGPGDVQWMTAGKGIVHAEMPASHHEDSIGFQLWINLPKEKKLNAPKYQEFLKGQLPVYEEEGIRVIVIAGQYKGVEALIQPESTAHYYDVHLSPEKSFDIDIPEGWNGLVYPYVGTSLNVNNQ